MDMEANVERRMLKMVETEREKWTPLEVDRIDG